MTFYINMINLEKDRNRNHYEVVELLSCFIDNICEVLDECSLYKEAILLYLFVDNFEKALQMMDKGFGMGIVDFEFVEELIQKVVELISEEKQQRTFSQRNYEHLA